MPLLPIVPMLDIIWLLLDEVPGEPLCLQQLPVDALMVDLSQKKNLTKNLCDSVKWTISNTATRIWLDMRCHCSKDRLV